MYAVIRTGGKQYRVDEGRSIRIDRLPGDPGDTIELGDVLLMGEGDSVTVGSPTVAGARVVGTIAEQGRAPKIVVFRYKAKTRSRKKTGHRQHFTRLVVSDILAAGQEPKPKTERKAAPEPAVETAAPPVEAAAVTEEKPKRSRRKAEVAEAAVAETAVAETATAETATAETSADAAAEKPAEKPKRSRKKTTE